jgi:hypothetical protein
VPDREREKEQPEPGPHVVVTQRRTRRNRIRKVFPPTAQRGVAYVLYLHA